ncbi:MAG: hypothetical protein EAZ89_06570 [Bacteroidetes bacterium]|jgi:Uncharacterised protein family (UPF0158)|nr:MAG: hypothetical protein EAZ89_06570 [Bacteroidota bacterium]
MDSVLLHWETLLDEVAIAMLDPTANHYFDTTVWEVVVAQKDEREEPLLRNQSPATPRRLPVAKESIWGQLMIARDFLENEDDMLWKQRLLDALQDSGCSMDPFLNLLTDNPAMFRRWIFFKFSAYRQKAESWLASLGLSPCRMYGVHSYVAN